MGVEPERAVAARDDQTDIAVDDIVRLEGFVDGIAHFVFGHRDFDAEGMRRFPETVDMLFETEDLFRVAPHPLKNTVAVKESVIEHADFCVFFVDKTLIEPYFR